MNARELEIKTCEKPIYHEVTWNASIMVLHFYSFELGMWKFMNLNKMQLMKK